MRKIWSEYGCTEILHIITVYEYLVNFNLLQCFATYRTSLYTVHWLLDQSSIGLLALTL